MKVNLRLLFKTLAIIFAVLVLLAIFCNVILKTANKDQLTENSSFKTIESTYNTTASWGGGEFEINKGVLYAKGTDTNRFLSEDSAAYHKEWTKIKNIESTNIVHLEVCNGTMIYLTADGKVYGMGSSEGIFSEETYSAIDERSCVRIPQLLMV